MGQPPHERAEVRPRVHPVMTSGESFDRLLAQERFLLVGFLAAVCRGRIPSGDAVEDLVQDTLAIAWTRRAEYDASRPIGPWLRGIAVRVAIGTVRREARRHRIAVNEAQEIIRIDGLAQRFTAIEEQVERRELTDGLKGCIDALPPTFRDVLERHYGGGHSITQIAIDLGISDDLASKRAIRGRALIERCLRVKRLVLGGSDAASHEEME